jgi:signal transduction histidine kinase
MSPTSCQTAPPRVREQKSITDKRHPVNDLVRIGPMAVAAAQAETPRGNSSILRIAPDGSLLAPSPYICTCRIDSPAVALFFRSIASEQGLIMASETERSRGTTPCRTRRNWLELGLIGFAAALTYAASSSADFYERFHLLLANYEGVQADELFIVTLGVLAVLSVFSFMRWKDARAELASRIAAEHELQVLSGRNRELARAMIGLQDSERKRIARELHDHFGQSCNAIRIDAVYLCNNLTEGTAEFSAAERISATADDLYQTVRGLLQELRPVPLDSLGLHGALQALCESWEERSAVTARCCRTVISTVLEKRQTWRSIESFRSPCRT